MFNNNISLSVIIPVFNESKDCLKYIYKHYAELKKLKYNFEIIIVDDHSTNNTYQLIKKNLNNNFKKNIKLIKSKKNYGPGNSIRLGASIASKENVMWIGAEDDVDIKQYIRHTNKLSKYELLIFYIKNNESRQFSRRLFSFIFTKILNYTFMLDLPYYNGVILMNRNNFLDLNIKSKRFFFSAEVKILSLKKKYKYINIPFYLKKNPKPNIRTILNNSNWKDVVFNYLRILFYYYFK